MKLKNIPNILSVFRIALVFVFAYVFVEHYPDGIILAACIFVLSGITDVIDGRLARKYNWESQLGRILDPVADKLMQCTALFCMWYRHVVPVWIFLFFVLKELLMGVGAIVLFRKKHVIGASKYFGKAAVVLFYAAVCTIILFGESIGDTGVNVICAFTAICASCALVMYYFNYLKNKNKKRKREVGQ